MIYRAILENYGKLILKGVGTTLLLAIVGTALGLIIALFLGSILSSKDSPFDSQFKCVVKKIVKAIINIYTTIFRGTPMIVQAIIFYYSFYNFGIKWSYTTAGIFTVTLNTAAYLTEVVRSGISSISNDQTEAGLAVGLSNFKTFLFIILPQALKNSMASIGNELIVNIKDTSVLSVILIVDLYNACKLAGATYGAFVEPMLIAAAIYFILTSFFSVVLRMFEKKLGAPTKALTSSN